MTVPLELDRRMEELHERIKRVEASAEAAAEAIRWLVEYASTLESALMKVLPACLLGEDGPSYTPAHVEICSRCAALAELESLPDAPLPDDENETGSED